MGARAALVPAALVAAAVACSSPKKPPSAQPPTAPAPAPSPVEIDWSAFDSASIRNPNDGWLRGGVPLPLAAPGLRFNPNRDEGARYGTVEVVRTLLEAAARVDRELGGLPVTINDLSLQAGGPLPHHRSHQSGRDVDVLFYQFGPDGRPIESVGAFFDPRGVGIDFKDLADPSDDVELTLDVPRTWLFVRALIESEHAQLQNIYVAEHIRALLLGHAQSADAPPTTVERFEALTCQPSYPHDDHFHLRFFCSADDVVLGCRDSQPMYPWQMELLAAAGTKARPLAPKRKQAEARIVTHEEARRDAGSMDAKVEHWLDLRKTWIDKPHPGRTYCP